MPERRAPRRGRPAPGRTGAPTPAARLPVGPVAISTGTVELVLDRADPRSVTVLVNGVPSSHLHLDEPEVLEFEYMQQMAALVAALPPGPLDAVHLGAAGCAMPRWLEAERPGSRQLAVDLDAELLNLVRTWFGLPRAPRLRLRAQDARAALLTLPTSSVDVVIRDVFAPDVTPAHLCTAEFLHEVVRVLRPGGLYLANCADRPPLRLARSEVATARTVLSDVALVAEPGLLRGRGYGNLVLAATSAPGSTQVSPAARRADSPAVDLDDAALARVLRSLPVPARLLHGTDLDAMVAGAPALVDGGAPWLPPS